MPGGRAHQTDANLDRSIVKQSLPLGHYTSEEPHIISQQPSRRDHHSHNEDQTQRKLTLGQLLQFERRPLNVLANLTRHSRKLGPLV